MPKNLPWIVGIYLCAGIAWLLLGATLALRTENSDTNQQSSLSSQWGSAQVQAAPTVRIARYADDKHPVSVPISSSRIKVALQLERRQKGLLWYNLYDVAFSARYTVKNPTSGTLLYVDLVLPDKNATYADFSFAVGGHHVEKLATLGSGGGIAIAPGGTTTIDVSYRTRGMTSWTYAFGDDVASVNDFAMTMTTNFQAIDFPANTLLPTTEIQAGDGRRLVWQYNTLVTGNGIGLAIPDPLQPGPLAQRITFWAPVALLFYLFIMIMVTTLRRTELHPMNYFFLACAFFAFHLLFAYLVDRISIGFAFTICSLVSMGLTISYLRLVVGWRFAAVEGGVTQLIYLILFSYALFNEGWSGLTITIGAIITLFVAMQLTARINWSDYGKVVV